MVDAVQGGAQEAPANPDLEIVEEVTVSRFADGTYRVGHFRKLDEDAGEGSNQPGLTREGALTVAAQLLSRLE